MSWRCGFVEARGLAKRYGRLVVFEDVYFHVSTGEALGVVGPNGSGKTTLLKIVSLLEPFDKGVIDLCGLKVLGENIRSFYRLRGVLVGYSSQTPTVVEELSVLDNILVGALRTSKSLEEALEKARYAAEMLDLEGYLDRRTGELSGGFKKRVEIARLVATNPPVMCFDEPFAHLDKEAKDLVKNLLQELKKKGKILLVASPGEREVEDIVDRRVELWKKA